MGRDSNSGHQLLLPPADWCPTFAPRTTQDPDLFGTEVTHQAMNTLCQLCKSPHKMVLESLFSKGVLDLLTSFITEQTPMRDDLDLLDTTQEPLTCDEAVEPLVMAAVEAVIRLVKVDMTRVTLSEEEPPATGGAGPELTALTHNALAARFCATRPASFTCARGHAVYMPTLLTGPDIVGAQPSQHGLCSDTMAVITSDCDAMRSPSIKWP